MGDRREFLRAIAPLLDATGVRQVAPDERQPGDIELTWDDEVALVVRPPALTGALHRLIEQVEVELGGPIAHLSRENKQAAVRLLDERGAFTLRRSVDDVADALGVSRITVYNYLNAIHR